MVVVVVLMLSLLALGVLSALWSRMSSSADGEPDAIVDRPTCSTCNGDDSRCEQECMMEAATREVEYYDDEELDRYRGRPSDCYTDTEADDFREVLMSMVQSDAKGWNRSLILRGINVPDQIKDELLLMIDGDT